MHAKVSPGKIVLIVRKRKKNTNNIIDIDIDIDIVIDIDIINYDVVRYFMSVKED